MKVIVKRPDEKIGHVEEVDNDLKALQEIVGHIQCVPIDDVSVMLCNDDGKILGLPFNLWLGFDPVVGTVIICGVDGDGFADVPYELEEWERVLKAWRN